MNPAIARKRRAKAYQSTHGNDHAHADHHHAGGGSINVGHAERQVSLIGGGLLAAYGLSKANLCGLALAAIGGALVWRGYSGHCQVYQMLGHSSADDHQHDERHEESQRVAQGVATMTR